MSLLVTINSTENVSPAKINDCISTVNSALGLGTIGQRLVKNSGNDFDTVWANPELKQLSTTSINLSSLSVGIGFIIDIPNCTFDVRSNLRLKCYSASTPTNYIIGLVYGVSGSLTVSINIEIISGTATVNDWVVVPYRYVENTFNSGLQTTFVANELFSALTLSGCTLTEYNVNSYKEGNKATINGYLKLASTGISPDAYFTLKDNYLILNGDSYNFVFGSSCQLQNGATFTSIASWLSNLTVGETNSKSILRFLTNSTVANGNTLTYRFSFSYVASKYSE